MSRSFSKPLYCSVFDEMRGRYFVKIHIHQWLYNLVTVIYERQNTKRETEKHRPDDHVFLRSISDRSLIAAGLVFREYPPKKRQCQLEWRTRRGARVPPPEGCPAATHRLGDFCVDLHVSFLDHRSGRPSEGKFRFVILPTVRVARYWRITSTNLMPGRSRSGQECILMKTPVGCGCGHLAWTMGVVGYGGIRFTRTFRCAGCLLLRRRQPGSRCYREGGGERDPRRREDVADGTALYPGRWPRS